MDRRKRYLLQSSQFLPTHKEGLYAKRGYHYLVLSINWFIKTITNLLLLSLLLASCGVAHKAATTTPEEGYIIYRQSAPEVTLTLLGDYAFHPLKKKYFADLDKSALKYLAHRLNGRRPQLMFASHTFVQP